MAATLGMGVGGVVQAGETHLANLRRERAYRAAFPPQPARRPAAAGQEDVSWPEWVPLRRNGGRHRRAQLQAQIDEQLAEAEQLDGLQRVLLTEGDDAAANPLEVVM